MPAVFLLLLKIQLELEIVFPELRKVFCLAAGRGPLEGIIAETSAFAVRRNEALFGTEHHSVSGLSGTDAVSAAFGDILAKQHGEPS